MMLAILNTHKYNNWSGNEFISTLFYLRMQHSGKIFIFLAKIKESILERTVLGMEMPLCIRLQKLQTVNVQVFALLVWSK